jgi:glycine betaine catabolism B
MANPVKIRATVQKMIKHTDSVASYVFTPQGRVPKFHAGQFLHLALDEYDPSIGWPESRVFSIASAPSERSLKLEITISAKGSFTQRIYNELEVDTTCWLKLPYGEFLFPEDRELILIAGGVGITPYLSLLKQRLEEKSAQPISLHYGIRSKTHYLFSDLLQQCTGELPNFNCSMYSDDGTIGKKGYIHLESIRSAAVENALYYLSGPPTMIDHFKANLIESGVHQHQIIVDDWE